MKPRSQTSLKRIFLLLVGLILLALAALVWAGLPLLQERGISLPFLPTAPVLSAQATALPTSTDTPVPLTPTLSLTPTETTVPISLLDPAAASAALQTEGVLILAMRDGYYSHLFAYHPLFLPLTRLTNTPWDDAAPAISPDGTRLAYSSRQNGYWDLYLIDFATGMQTRLTDTAEYESAPSWSPDGLWIAYERSNGSSMDIYLLSVADPQAAPIQLTDDPAADHSPAWAPQGREIAFVSNRSGDEEIWLARLDVIENRYTNLSSSSDSRERYPVWSHDGEWLAWTTDKTGSRTLMTWNKKQVTRAVGKGDRAVWSPEGQYLFSELRGPNQNGLTAYDTVSGKITFPLTDLPGTTYGMAWVRGPLPAWLATRLVSGPLVETPVLWQPVVTRTVVPGGRSAVVPLEDVTAPQPLLHDEVDEAFIRLREEIAAETGWDALSSLENAFLSLTTPPTPSIQDDWLYTGRAFALNPLLLSAGWMAIVREDYDGLTYWRVYLKARYQDGSMGVPLTEQSWDLNARFTSSTRAYEQGGLPGQTPPGFWVDLTEIASRYGWQRLPSWINWRTFYPAIRFNQFVMTGGLNWYQAMAQIYPVEALMTATPIPTHTLTPTKTPEETRVPPTNTPSPTATTVPTRRPTWTPIPTQPVP